MNTDQKIKAISALNESLKLYVNSASLDTPMQEHRSVVKAMSDKLVELTNSIDVNADDKDYIYIGTKANVEGESIIEREAILKASPYQQRLEDIANGVSERRNK